MYELRDQDGRLIVVLPMRTRHYGLLYCVFVDGTTVAQYRTYREAIDHAKTLAGDGGDKTPVATPRSVGE
jgi:hypothetical protein